MTDGADDAAGWEGFDEATAVAGCSTAGDGLAGGMLAAASVLSGGGDAWATVSTRDGTTCADANG
jgi:hypothetical protein